MKKTISEVVKNDLCTGCGTCISLCPNEAILLKIDENKGIYVPELNEDKCNLCGICYKVCPGQEVDFKALNREIFGKEPKDILIGNYLNCYVGHATDHEIRYNSASGGLITALLIFALEQGLIDGALITKMKRDKPLEPEPFIARTKEEIIEASKSKYCPVPLNIALRAILMASEGERFAVVGLPCHIHGLRKAQQTNAKLKKRIVLCLGVFCGFAPSFLGTEFMLHTKEATRDDVMRIFYRSEGWPGGMTIILNDRRKIFFPYHDYWEIFGSRFFSPKRCMVCYDGVAELADICFGDAWLPEFSNDIAGKSIIICRTKNGSNIVKNAMLKEYIDLRETNVEKVIQSQAGMLHFKKTLNSRIFWLRIANKKIPIYYLSNEVLKPEIIDYIRAILFYLHIEISKNRNLWFFISHIKKFEWIFVSKK